MVIFKAETMEKPAAIPDESIFHAERVMGLFTLLQEFPTTKTYGFYLQLHVNSAGTPTMAVVISYNKN